MTQDHCTQTEHILHKNTPKRKHIKQIRMIADGAEKGVEDVMEKKWVNKMLNYVLFIVGRILCLLCVTCCLKIVLGGFLPESRT